MGSPRTGRVFFSHAFEDSIPSTSSFVRWKLPESIWGDPGQVHVLWIGCLPGESHSMCQRKPSNQSQRTVYCALQR